MCVCVCGCGKWKDGDDDDDDLHNKWWRWCKDVDRHQRHDMKRRFCVLASLLSLSRDYPPHYCALHTAIYFPHTHTHTVNASPRRMKHTRWVDNEKKPDFGAAPHTRLFQPNHNFTCIPMRIEHQSKSGKRALKTIGCHHH